MTPCKLLATGMTKWGGRNADLGGRSEGPTLFLSQEPEGAKIKALDRKTAIKWLSSI